MRVHGNHGLRVMKHHLRPTGARGSSSTTSAHSSGKMVVSGGSVYSEQLSKTVTNMPELNRQFGGLMSKKKGKKVFLKI
jgi:hypothetical protein